MGASPLVVCKQHHAQLMGNEMIDLTSVQARLIALRRMVIAQMEANGGECDESTDRLVDEIMFELDELDNLIGRELRLEVMREDDAVRLKINGEGSE